MPYHTFQWQLGELPGDNRLCLKSPVLSTHFQSVIILTTVVNIVSSTQYVSNGETPALPFLNLPSRWQELPNPERRPIVIS